MAIETFPRAPVRICTLLFCSLLPAVKGQVRGVSCNNDLILIALLAMYDATGDEDYLRSVQDVMRRRGMPPGFVHPFRSQPLCGVSFELYWRTKDRPVPRRSAAILRRGRFALQPGWHAPAG
jgi:hypothetical protein